MERESGENHIPKQLLQDAEKKQHEFICRNLWKSCFGDPITYEDFYFDKVYPRNSVYCMQEKGMLHLNPYLCSVAGRRYMLHYIVGVATGEAYRRQGIMRGLLQQALLNMYAAKEPFTYLMPANEQYYTPFDFCRVCRKTERIIENLPRLKLQSATEKIKFVPYLEIKQKAEKERQRLFQRIEQWLDKLYTVHAVHDEAYFDLLFEEKLCQNGDVIFCFEEENAMDSFLGIFAYAMDGKRLCVEQMILENQCYRSQSELQGDVQKYDGNAGFRKQNKWINILEEYYKEWFTELSEISVISSYPYMIRIVHMESFLNLFSECLADSLNGADGILVIDNIIRQNNGFYHFVKEKGDVSVSHYEEVPEGEKYVTMTVSQITETVFGEDGNVYFAEIV